MKIEYRKHYKKYKMYYALSEKQRQLISDRLPHRPQLHTYNQDDKVKINDLLIYNSDDWLNNVVKNKFDKKTWVDTKNSKCTHSPKYVGIDCEMVETKEGLELSRVSLLKFIDDNIGNTYEIIYDSYVKPTNKILDYKTQYSGINENTLKDVTTTLKMVQQDILSLINSNTIIIGHSPENDLRTLKMLHEKVIDTALVYLYFRGSHQLHKLKYLTKCLLKKNIQIDIDGHSSVEDAWHAMQLFRVKMLHGHRYGTWSSMF